MIVNHDGLVLKVGRQTPLAARPVAWTLRHGPGERLLWPLVALFWLTMTLLLVWDMASHGETWGLAMPGLFLLIGIGLYLFGIRAALWRRRETIGPDTVAVDERDSAGGSRWSEPLSRYRGVAVVEVEREKESRLGRLRVVVLDHERADRRIVLWSELLSRDVERRQEGYAGWLGLPMVTALPRQAGEKGGETAVVTRA
jgi:hypothetical protein